MRVSVEDNELGSPTAIEVTDNCNGISTEEAERYRAAWSLRTRWAGCAPTREIFALYLRNYPSTDILLRGQRIDPQASAEPTRTRRRLAQRLMLVMSHLWAGDCRLADMQKPEALDPNDASD